jgi:hypothetical protein
MVIVFDHGTILVPEPFHHHHDWHTAVRTKRYKSNAETSAAFRRESLSRQQMPETEDLQQRMLSLPEESGYADRQDLE